MKKCSMCDSDATYVDSNRRLCDKHYRLCQMRDSSRNGYGMKHTIQELESMLPSDMKCPHCKVDMIWRREKTQKGVTNQITIQHWRDGTVGYLCHRCNTRHASMDGDSYQEMQPDHKFCPGCKTIKHESEFGLKNSRAVLKRNSYCKPCNLDRAKKYREVRDVDEYNRKQREYRARRKAAGNPVKRKASH